MVSRYRNNLSDSKFFIFTALTHQKSAFLQHMIYPKSETLSPNLTLILRLCFCHRIHGEGFSTLSNATWKTQFCMMLCVAIKKKKMVSPENSAKAVSWFK